ncbi:MAG: ribonuclease III [Oscillospiraceae bacterium]|jgi:ribonuclease-3 family protein|nr:ribonuclease III [Oscillospiraceae bacterium]
MDFLHPNCDPAALHTLHTLALAHVGDGVFELMVRTRLCLSGRITAGGLHRETVRRVRAGAQAGYARQLWEMLSEEERAVFRRGRNARVRAVPQAATREEYQLATALEALWGYLFLTGRAARLEALFARLPLDIDD